MRRGRGAERQGGFRTASPGLQQHSRRLPARYAPRVPIDRRGFFRLVAAAALLPARRAGAAGGAPAIHERTRNTLLGALGPRRDPLEEAGPFKSYPGAERLALPPAGDAAGSPLAEVLRGGAAAGFAAEPLSLAQLARVLHLTNGVTGRMGGTLLRAAPSAGALYAGEVYLVAERVQGLAPGVYYFAVADAELVRVAAGPFMSRAAAALERPADVAGAPALVILCNVFRRYTVRYRNRGYRYALIDSGHIGENLRLAARAEGLAEAAPLRFEDDALGELLGIDGRDEAVCALHALGRPGPPRAGPARTLVERQQADPELPRGPDPLTRRYHEATKLVPAAAAAPPPADPPAAATATPARFALALEPARVPAASVEEVIRRRRSASRFEETQIAAGDLAFVLEAAYGREIQPRAPGIDLYVVPHRVEGVAPGLYRFEPRARRLAGLHRRDLRVELTRACIAQDKVASAAAAVLVAARFEPSASALGGRRYRDQLLESGAIAQRIYLAAEALGLAARNLAAFLDDDLNALVGLDPRRAGVVHLTVFGPGE